MAQINLLKQSAPANNYWEIIPKIVVKILVVILIALVVYYIFLYLKLNRTQNQIVSVKAQISSDRETALKSPARDELLTRQVQLKTLDGLVSQHLYWSQLLPKLASATLKKATYTNLTVGSASPLTLSVNVPTLEDLDKYLQVFNLPVVNKYFSDVKIGSYHKLLGKNSSSISFDVNMKFNPSIIQYSPGGGSN